jgi:hypothetical protein
LSYSDPDGSGGPSNLKSMRNDAILVHQSHQLALHREGRPHDYRNDDQWNDSVHLSFL